MSSQKVKQVKVLITAAFCALVLCAASVRAQQPPPPPPEKPVQEKAEKPAQDKAAQDKAAQQKTTKEKTAQEKTEKTKSAGKAAGSQNMAGAQMGTLTATLVDAEKNAADKSATVQVKVSGVKLIDPALTNKVPKKGEAHLHYQIDGGPVIATTAPKLSFHQLSSGKHQITVTLANNDHSPIGSPQTLEITVP